MVRGMRCKVNAELLYHGQGFFFRPAEYGPNWKRPAIHQRDILFSGDFSNLAQEAHENQGTVGV